MGFMCWGGLSGPSPSVGSNFDNFGKRTTMADVV